MLDSHSQVLSGEERSFASDVYSFGLVMWEVVSRQLPWARKALPQDIYISVVFKGDRPIIPDDAPTDIADIIKACWAATPKCRPNSKDVLAILQSHFAS